MEFNEILLNNQVIVYLLSEAVLLALLGVAFVMTVGLIRHWDFGSFSPRQFALERRAYLVMTIVIFVAVVKIFTTAYFAFTIDSLAVLVPGAMCGAGVISANDYGLPLLFTKLLIIFLMLFWVALNSYDNQSKNYPVFRLKSWLYILIVFAVLVEGWLDVSYLTHIDLTQPVSCCSALFGQLEGANPLPFGLDTTTMLILYYMLGAMLILALLTKQKFLALVGSGLFVYVAYYAVVYFFGTYIYQLPTHNCPFCMLQKEYYYVGYLVWGSLFFGVFLGAIWSLMEMIAGVSMESIRKISIYSIGAFILLCSGYVAIYYLRTGAFL